MNVGLIQKAERQMMLDGKSASEIDAMKSAYRKQVFNPDGYSQTAGLGSFASGGEAYVPGPGPFFFCSLACRGQKWGIEERKCPAKVPKEVPPHFLSSIMKKESVRRKKRRKF